jgi:STE24 endopeptidase
MTGRRRPLLVALLLVAALLVMAGFRVPWHVWGPEHPAVDVARDFSPAEQARSAAFRDAVLPVSYGSLLLGLLVSLAVGLTRAGPWLIAQVSRPFGRHWTAQAFFGTVVLLVIGRLATLPLDARTEAIERDYGLSRETWGSWLGAVATAAAVSALLTALAALLLVALARRFPRAWWAWAAGAAAALVVLGSFLFPVVVQPLFESRTPLPAGPQRDDLLALARTEGVQVDQVEVSDASTRTTALNAYVSGFGATRTIVVYDTLLRSATPAEVRVIVAHELGHAKEDDVLTGTVLGALGAAAAVCAVAALLRCGPVLRRAGAAGAGDPRVVPLVLAVVAVGSLAVAPAVNVVSRHLEARADRHALEATHDPDAFVSSFHRLAVVNLSSLRPNPVLAGFFATHPSTPSRMAFARAWEARNG